jgi:beta-lactamase superfamily II metal-dependent hydrolase
MKKIVFLFIVVFITSEMFAQTNTLPKWEKGFLDIHFISTGRGSSAFYILPDGTTMLIDVGELLPIDSVRHPKAMPNDSKSPAQWVADYIYQFHPDGKNAKLDYALITHFHDDHMGSFGNARKTQSGGGYKLSGITELGSIIPIEKFIDRGYDYPVNFSDPDFQKKIISDKYGAMMFEQFNEYWKFIDYQKKTNGLKYEKFKVGSSNQIRLTKSPADFPEFKIKNLFANGDVSSVYDSSVATRKFKAGEQTSENDLSIGIRISYGKFDFYTGGDIPGIGYTGCMDESSMESLAAPVIGPVDVATLNHHGNRDTQNDFFVKTIQPRVWIGQSWTVRHPGEEVLRRITSQYIYPGERDVFTNFLHPANQIYLGKLADDNYKSISGHIVVRVYPKGDNYDVFILNDKDEQREVIAQYHYQSR